MGSPEDRAVYIIAPRGLPRMARDQGTRSYLEDAWKVALKSGTLVLYEVRPVAK